MVDNALTVGDKLKYWEDHTAEDVVTANRVYTKLAPLYWVTVSQLGEHYPTAWFFEPNGKPNIAYDFSTLRRPTFQDMLERVTAFRVRPRETLLDQRKVTDNHPMDRRSPCVF